jgi:DUF4097 and DUF4098 domain-containing protein YvlB
MLRPCRVVLGLTCFAVSCAFAAAQRTKEFRYAVGPGASISISNESGPISVRPSLTSEVVIVSKFRSSKIDIDGKRNGNRVVVRTHLLQPGSPDEARVEYTVLVPADVNLVLQASDGPINIERVTGDVTCETESSHVQVKDGGNGHVHVRTVDGPVTLSNVRNGHVEIQSISGDVNVNDSTGPYFKIHTSKGKINYDGDFGGDGDYSLTTHAGDITVTMPGDASVELSAKSVSGVVTDAFQLQPSKHPTMSPAEGKSFAGTSNSGTSSVTLRSFSGRINVKKK